VGRILRTSNLKLMIVCIHRTEMVCKGCEFRGLRRLWEDCALVRRYQFHDTGRHSPIKKTNQIDDNRSLRGDGANLAAFLHLLKVRHVDSYDLIRKTVQQVAPFFFDFQLEPLALNPDTIKLEWRHKQSDRYWDASAFSDGTLRFIALATLFLQPVELRPSVILLDEPELGFIRLQLDCLPQ